MTFELWTGNPLSPHTCPHPPLLPRGTRSRPLASLRRLPVLSLLAPAPSQAADRPLAPGGAQGAQRGSGALTYSLLSIRPMSSYATDDDIVFEDFARLRLKGMKDEDYEDQFC